MSYRLWKRKTLKAVSRRRLSDVVVAVKGVTEISGFCCQIAQNGSDINAAQSIDSSKKGATFILRANMCLLKTRVLAFGNNPPLVISI